MIGEKLGGYAVTGKLGEGGMGVVYRATDSKLQREVALKVLPQSLIHDPQFMGRFEREALVLASLNHPHIAAIYGVEEAAGQRALVMELVEGDDLAVRIARGRLPLEEALRIARQLAEALEAAHDKGVIHRDLKPANIKLTPEGNVKVLDFGLAKALQDVGASSGAIDLTRSPTISLAATQAGVILGTAGYMSPEQARAQPADRRADVWAFGVILFEMLGGRRAFAGETISDTLAKVLEREPDWSTLPGDTPPALRHLLERCLIKNPRQRLQSIGEARIAIEELLADPELGRRSAAAEAAAAPTAAGWRRALPWALVAAAAAWAVAATVGMAGRSSAPQAAPPLRVSMEIGNETLFSILGAAAELSPDGRWIAYSTGEQAEDLYLRALDRLESTLLVEGGEQSGAYHPFFSPDSRWVGYVTPAELRKIPVTGGTPLTLCPVSRSRGATWLEDDTVVFAASPASGLSRVPAIGGEPQPLTTLDAEKGELTHRWPQALPGGHAVLFTSHDGASTFDRATLEVVTVATGERKVVHRGGSYGRYVPSGHLVFVNQSTVFAAPFDLDRLELTGSPAPVLAGVTASLGEGGAQFSFSSSTGTMAYVEGSSAAPSYSAVSVDRSGVATPLWPELGTYAVPRFSPDGRRLAMSVLRGDNWDIWVYDLERGVATRLTFDSAIETEQVWTPDGEYLVYSSDAEGADSLYRKRADGSGEAERLTEPEAPQWASSISPDGRFVAYTEASNRTDIGVLALDGSAEKGEVFLSTPFAEGLPAFSPDGRFLAYASTESGRWEIYVRPFPAGQGKWQVSDAGGSFPLWSRDGRELYWRTNEGVMVADVETGDGSFRASRARQLFSGSFQGGIDGLAIAGFAFPDYDVAPDGQRFVLFPDPRKEGRGTHPHLILVTDWFGELRRTFARVPG